MSWRWRHSKHTKNRWRLVSFSHARVWCQAARFGWPNLAHGSAFQYATRDRRSCDSVRPRIRSSLSVLSM